MTYFFILIIQSLWFSLPMYAANMIPVFVKRVPFLNIPIDGGKTWKGIPIFGSHKTIRGFVFGVAASITVVYIQKILFLNGAIWESISIMNYELVSIYLFGFLLGFGALTGDVVESFFKRRIGIASGEPWFIFDQIDYAIGGLLFVSVVYIPSIPHIIIISTLGFFGSLLSSYIGYYIGLKDSKI